MTLRPNGRPPFRADHVGSLLRPPALRQAFRRHAAGRIDDAAFRAAQDAAIRAVVALQADCGLEVATDGEFRRISYWEKFVRLTRGLTVKPANFRFHDAHGHESEFTAPYAEAKLGRGAAITLDEYEFVASVATATPKITMPAPSTMHFYRYRDFADPKVYPEPKAFFADLGGVYRAEIAALAAAGCRYVQLDEVALAVLCDPAARAQLAADGVDAEALVDLYVDAINAALADRPAGMVVGLHMCRGNYKGMYLSEGGYDTVAEKLFGRAQVNHFLLEFDTPRAGDFAPLRFVPKDKGVVLGLVCSKRAELEPVETLQRRVADAAKVVDADRLAISPQCGFASTVGGNPVTEADERAKLRRCVDAAGAIWG